VSKFESDLGVGGGQLAKTKALISTPDNVHSDFLDRFKNVISKLENRLERITHEMDN